MSDIKYERLAFITDSIFRHMDQVVDVLDEQGRDFSDVDMVIHDLLVDHLDSFWMTSYKKILKNLIFNTYYVNDIDMATTNVENI